MLLITTHNKHHNLRWIGIILFGTICIILYSTLHSNDTTTTSILLPNTSLSVREVIYNDINSPYTYTPESAPHFDISADMELYETGSMLTHDHSISLFRGKLELCSYTYQDLCRPFSILEEQVQNKLCNVTSTYRTDIDDDLQSFYLLLITSSKEILIAHGTKADPHEEIICWLYEMKQD